MEKKLTLQQKKAINFNEGPLLIIAGAGTGKTTVITERIKHLILEKKINPENILALTFTEKAAKEMQDRVDLIMPFGYSEMWIDTFHGFCEKILRENAINIGLDSSFKLLTETESILLVKKNFEKFNFNYFKPLGNPNKFISALLFHFSRLKDEDVSCAQYLKWVELKIKDNSDEIKEEFNKYLELANAYKIYEELKNEKGLMDFSDLIFNTLFLFRQRKAILNKYQEKFEYILVDEFQDTNYIQNEIAILLSKKYNNINVVGDDDQAIYRWRGAAISNMIKFKDKFRSAEVIALTNNFRSTQKILDGAYKLIQNNNPDRLEIKEKIEKKLIADKKIKGEAIRIIISQNEYEEAEQVAREIKKNIETKKYNYKDVAVLVRANDHALPFIKIMEKHNIPCQFLGPKKLFHQEEIKDLIAFLKIIADPNDNASFFRVLNLANFNIENFSLSVFLNFAKRKNLNFFETFLHLDEMPLKSDQKEKFNKIYEIFKKNLEKLKTEKSGQVLYFFIKETGILENYLKNNDQDLQIKAQNTALFFEKIKKFEIKNENANILDLLEWIDLLMQSGEDPNLDNYQEEENKVNVLTIHSSKGLEFKIVFLINLVTNRFPSTERKEQIPIPEDLIKEILPSGNYHLQEERRLFYVGMTRAKEILYFTLSKFYNEGKRERKISPFVTEALDEKEIKSLIEKNSKDKNQISLLNFKPVEKKQDFSFKKLQISYISYSQIQTFDFCNLHYKLKYIFNIPTQVTQSQSFGTSLHSTLKEFYLENENNKQLKKINIESIYKKNWIEDGYFNKKEKEKYFIYGLKIINDYLENNFNPKIKSQVEVPFKFFIKNLCIGGIIDRIDFLNKNEIEIIDYKTGQNIPDEKKLIKNLQLKIYALAINLSKIKNLSPIINPNTIKLSLYYLEKNKKLSIFKTKEELELAKNEILEKAKEIENSDFKCTGGMFCKDCEYKMICKTN